MEKSFNYPPLTELLTLSESEIREWFSKVTIWRDEEMASIRYDAEQEITTLRTEAEIERKRICALMDLKRKQMKCDGTPDARDHNIAIRKAVRDLDFDLRMFELEQSRKLSEIGYRRTTDINAVQRQWEKTHGQLCQALRQIKENDPK